MDSVPKKSDDARAAALTSAVLKVGDGGRGFVVETEKRERVVITAAHCLASDGRQLPPAHPWSYTEERLYPNLLGPLKKSKPAVWAECRFADPLADIAVLASPDNQVLSDQADEYEKLIGDIAPLPVVDAPKEDTKRIQSSFSDKTFEVPRPGQSAALVLSLDGKWVKCSVKRHGAWLSIDQAELVSSGMSGSPIVSIAGHAIGLVSTGSLNPVLLEVLPPRIRLLKRRRD